MAVGPYSAGRCRDDLRHAGYSWRSRRSSCGAGYGGTGKQLSEFDAFELIAWRMLCAALVMAVIVTFRRSWPTIGRALSTANGIGRLAIAAALLAINWGSYVWAVSNDRVIETALGYFLAPLLTMLLGVVVYHEVPTAA